MVVDLLVFLVSKDIIHIRVYWGAGRLSLLLPDLFLAHSSRQKGKACSQNASQVMQIKAFAAHISHCHTYSPKLI